MSDQSAELLKLLNQLWADEKVGETVRRRAKEIRPEITIPDDHPVAVKVRGEVHNLRGQLSDLQAKLLASEQEKANALAESTLREALGKAQSRFKLTDDGMAGTIKLMQERQIADAEAAAALYVDSLPKNGPSVPNAFLPKKMNLFGTTNVDEQWRSLHENPDQFFADTVNAVLSEMPFGS